MTRESAARGDRLAVVDGEVFESRLADAMVDAGGTLLADAELATLIMRFLRR